MKYLKLFEAVHHMSDFHKLGQEIEDISHILLNSWIDYMKYVKRLDINL